MTEKQFNTIPSWVQEEINYLRSVQGKSPDIFKILIKELLGDSFNPEANKDGEYNRVAKLHKKFAKFFETEEEKPFVHFRISNGEIDDLDSGNWENSPTQFSLYVGDQNKAQFSLATLPGCCGIAVLTGMFVNVGLQKQGLGTLLQEFAVELAKQYGYGLLLCSYRNDKESSHGLIKKLRWKKLVDFVSPRTRNKIILRSYKLN